MQRFKLYEKILQVGELPLVFTRVMNSLFDIYNDSTMKHIEENIFKH